MTLMLRMIQRDMRQAIYDGYCDILRAGANDAKSFLRATEIIGDRTEGRPTQTVVTEHRRSTTFAPIDVTPTPTAVEAPAAGEGQVDLAAGLPEAPPPPPAPLPGPELAILPPLDE